MRSDEQLQHFEDFRRAGEAVADDHERDGLAVKAAALRGALVILGNQVIESARLNEPGYSEALIALYEITS